MPVANSRFSRPRAISPSASEGTLPCSAVRCAASSWRCGSTRFRMRNRISVRFESDVARHPGNARAAATAASTLADAKSTSRATWPVAGLKISHAWTRRLTRRPLIQRPTLSASGLRTMRSRVRRAESSTGYLGSDALWRPTIPRCNERPRRCRGPFVLCQLRLIRFEDRDRHGDRRGAEGRLRSSSPK